MPLDRVADILGYRGDGGECGTDVPVKVGERWIVAGLVRVGGVVGRGPWVVLGGYRRASLACVAPWVAVAAVTGLWGPLRAVRRVWGSWALRATRADCAGHGRARAIGGVNGAATCSGTVRYGERGCGARWRAARTASARAPLSTLVPRRTLTEGTPSARHCALITSAFTSA